MMRNMSQVQIIQRGKLFRDALHWFILNVKTQIPITILHHIIWFFYRYVIHFITDVSLHTFLFYFTVLIFFQTQTSKLEQEISVLPEPVRQEKQTMTQWVSTLAVYVVLNLTYPMTSVKVKYCQQKWTLSVSVWYVCVRPGH